MAESASVGEVAAQQAEMPFALVQGEPLTVVPQDLYIPPDALEIILETFEGPLDLLLYLIKRQNLDVLNIPIARITEQYMGYIQLMDNLRLELAAEYLLMAAMLAEIKSRMLLPRQAADEDETDPRAELVRRLQEYERYRQAAEDVDALPRREREIHLPQVQVPENDLQKPQAEVSLQEILLALGDVVQRAEQFASHFVEREPLSVRERMSHILEAVKGDEFLPFNRFFKAEEGRMGVVVSLLAMLELIRESLIELVQAEPMAPIYVRVHQAVSE